MSRGPWRRGLLPNGAEVRAAVVAACDCAEAKPEHVLAETQAIRVWVRGLSHASKEAMAISRARCYAALALRCLFEDGQAAAIARMVGAPTPASYFNNIDSAMKDRMIWFNNDKFMAVVEAVEAFQKKTYAAKPEREEVTCSDSAGM